MQTEGREAEIAERSQSEAEIKTLIECIMDGKPHLDLAGFKTVTETLCSDLFLIVSPQD